VPIGGSLGRVEATGRGCAIAAREAAKRMGLKLDGATVVVQGFGNVGSIAAYLLADMGCKIIAASDTGGGVCSKAGFDPRRLIEHKNRNGSVKGYPGTDMVTNEQLLEIPCDILVPSALEGQINGENAPRIKTKLIVEGANGPTTPDADDVLDDRKIMVIPDILANAGGVIVSYFEWVQGLQQFFWTEDEVNQNLERIMVRAFGQVVQVAEERKVNLRMAAMIRAIDRVAEALYLRGIYP
jgi:glutamate dehydrogenase/leucine dehydrogenase